MATSLKPNIPPKIVPLTEAVRKDALLPTFIVPELSTVPTPKKVGDLGLAESDELKLPPEQRLEINIHREEDG